MGGPCQEKQNENYFINNGTAIRTYKNEPIEHVLDIAMYNEKRVNQMIEMCKVIGKPNSSKTVVDEVIRIYNEGKWRK